MTKFFPVKKKFVSLDFVKKQLLKNAVEIKLEFNTFSKKSTDCSKI